MDQCETTWGGDCSHAEACFHADVFSSPDPVVSVAFFGRMYQSPAALNRSTLPCAAQKILRWENTHVISCHKEHVWKRCQRDVKTLFFVPVAASTCNISKCFNHIGVEMFQADQVFLLADGTLCTDAGSHVMLCACMPSMFGMGYLVNMKTLGRFLHQWFLFTKCFHLFRWCGINMVCIH